ncbi:hypothetical protein R1flu_009921 [Riccia fluitans]|uniref:Orc1-like AAA ATPase domain-containing protein n=1 Tax=Riccia fluitans TaxID=41844 RepID=A0ABD1Z637_9MARC
MVVTDPHYTSGLGVELGAVMGKKGRDGGLFLSKEGSLRQLTGEECRKFLGDRFPGRRDQVDDLLCILGEPSDIFPPVLVYGSPATGKTSIVREALSLLGRPHAYVSCRSCHSPRLVFESVLNQILGHVRSRENNYTSARKCEKLTDFVTHLVDACRGSGKLERTVYLVFDNVELIRDWASGGSIMSSLLKLAELTRLPNLGLIFVSNAGPDTFQLATASREPLPIFFRDYSNEELYQILTMRQPNSELYSFFLKSSLAPFSRASRKVTELAEGLHPLFLKYCEPLLSGKVALNDQGKRELYKYVKGYIQPALGQSFSISEPEKSRPGTDQELKAVCSTRPLAKTGIGFHLSLCSKYLLLAVYIASRNPSTLDDSLFGSGDGVKANKRRRRSSVSSMDKEETLMQEKHLKGPSLCSLERLIAIFQCIAVDSHVICEKSECSQLFFAEESERYMKDVPSNVLVELVTLASVNLVLKSSSNPLEGFPKFRANVDTDFIHKVARSINFPLDKYLLHA